MKMRRTYLALGLVVAGAWLAPGCGGDSESDSGKTTGGTGGSGAKDSGNDTGTGATGGTTGGTGGTAGTGATSGSGGDSGGKCKDADCPPFSIGSIDIAGCCLPDDSC